MSAKPPGLRVRRLNSSDNMNQKPLNRTRENIHAGNNFSSETIKKVKIPMIHVKNFNQQEQSSTSRRKLKVLNSTRAIRRLNLSMYSPSNVAIKSSRARIVEHSLPPRPQFPMTPEQAIESFKETLSEHELLEIFDYPQIYYFRTCHKPLQDPSFNRGYDNDKGDYNIFIGDHIEYRYEILSFLGKGSFGQVCKCFDHKSKETFAIKVIKNKKRYHKQGLVEVRLLEDMKSKDLNEEFNIVKIIRNFLFRSHLWMVFELLSMNLFEFIKINGFSRIKTSLVAKFAVQLLTSLDFTSSLNIIHCDLKPENILLKNSNKSGIKIIDFGSGCYANQRIYTYIQSRFYRAPEIMLGVPYTCSIDMWSLACVLGEIHAGYPIFPGENEQEQFLRIAEVFGMPDKDLVAVSTRKKVFFDSKGELRVVPNSRGKIRTPGSRSFQDVLRTDDLLFLEFLEFLLVWDPRKRPSPRQALEHPWILRFFNRGNSPQKKRMQSKGFVLKEL
jgi:dual specificity tyrosine-phosphorylation-regulated kinase 2/3/4